MNDILGWWRMLNEAHEAAANQYENGITQSERHTKSLTHTNTPDTHTHSRSHLHCVLERKRRAHIRSRRRRRQRYPMQANDFEIVEKIAKTSKIKVALWDWSTRLYVNSRKQQQQFATLRMANGNSNKTTTTTVAMKSTLVGRSYLLFTVKTNSIIVIIFGWMRIIQSSTSNNVQYIPVFCAQFCCCDVVCCWAVRAVSYVRATFYSTGRCMVLNVSSQWKALLAKSLVYTQAPGNAISSCNTHLTDWVVGRYGEIHRIEYAYVSLEPLCDLICVRESELKPAAEREQRLLAWLTQTLRIRSHHISQYMSNNNNRHIKWMPRIRKESCTHELGIICSCWAVSAA